MYNALLHCGVKDYTSKRGVYLMHPGVRGFLGTSGPHRALQKEARAVRQATVKCSVKANNF